MQSGQFKYKPHIYSFLHIASSQTACVNLFLPILTSPNANEIIKQSGIAPADFDSLDVQSLFRGFQFEYPGGKLLEDNSGVITDSDVAIAYLNKKKEKNLWLIEHKLTETNFTHCGGYKTQSKAMQEKPQYKENCLKYSLEDIIADHSLCYYHAVSGYEYWNVMDGSGKDFFYGAYDKKGGCPFRKGMNQLWRNQLIAMAMEREKEYKQVCLSVVKHPKNTSLNKTIEAYKRLTNNAHKFSAFTSLDLISACEKAAPGLKDWIEWYKKVYWITNE